MSYFMTLCALCLLFFSLLPLLIERILLRILVPIAIAFACQLFLNAAKGETDRYNKLFKGDRTYFKLPSIPAKIPSASLQIAS